MLWLRLIFVCGLAALCAANIIRPGHRIYNGEPIDITRAPYMAAFNLYEYSDPVGAVCGAGIISEYYLLTAAHCARTIPDMAGKKVIGVGNTYVTHLEWLEVETSGIHELWGTDGLNYDIAYIKLRNPLSFNDRVQAIPLTNVKPEVNQTVYYAGWGYWTDDSAPDQLQGAPFKIVNVEEWFVKSRSDTPGTQTGGGDSGSPVALDGVLVGIHSFIDSDRVAGAVSVFRHRDWIREKTGV